MIKPIHYWVSFFYWRRGKIFRYIIHDNRQKQARIELLEGVVAELEWRLRRYERGDVTQALPSSRHQAVQCLGRFKGYYIHPTLKVCLLYDYCSDITKLEESLDRKIKEVSIEFHFKVMTVLQWYQSKLFRWKSRDVSKSLSTIKWGD